MRRAFLVAAMCGVLASSSHAQEVSLEYEVKAAYLFNFVRFVDWPANAQRGPITICLVGWNPFGTALEETLRGETINGRSIVARVVADVEAGCHVVFVPDGAAPGPLLKAARLSPILTVGETRDFISAGGIINFILDNGTVRFEISQSAASRANLQISSRLLRLARQGDRASRAP